MALQTFSHFREDLGMPYPICLTTKAFTSCSFTVVYRLMRYVLRGFRYPTFCLLCGLLGSRVQLNRAIHYRPFGTPTQGIQTVS